MVARRGRGDIWEQMPLTAEKVFCGLAKLGLGRDRKLGLTRNDIQCPISCLDGVRSCCMRYQ